MASTGFAEKTSPQQFSQTERKRREASGRPLTQKEINALLSMRFGGKPLFASIEMFYSDIYKKVLERKGRQMTKEEFETLCNTKNNDGTSRYQPSDLTISNGEYRNLTEEQALETLGLQKIDKYRNPTEEEINLLYSDLFSKEISSV